MQTEGTPYGFGRHLKLPEAMRSELRVPLGRLLDGKEFARQVKGLERLVTVGDYCTMEALKASSEPAVAVVDFKIKRKRDDHMKSYASSSKVKVVEVENEAAHISPDAWRALQDAYAGHDRVLIQVRGEEDLVALPAIALAPRGFTIAYGLPDRGVVLVEADEKAKSKVNDILSRMEVLDEG
ncbi:MAG: GTP-dependent dephospho-CoA kinase family protein [Thermoplasmata archaeon]